MDGEQLEMLHQVIIATYPNDRALRRMIRFKLNVNLRNIASNNSNLSEMAFDVIEHFEAKGQLDSLIFALANSNSEHLSLQKYLNTYHPNDSLEHKKNIEPHSPKFLKFLDEEFSSSTNQLANCVSQIEDVDFKNWFVEKIESMTTKAQKVTRENSLSLGDALLETSSYEWATRDMQQVKGGEIVRAVHASHSLLSATENSSKFIENWKTDGLRTYLEENTKAIQRGAKILRIFILPDALFVNGEFCSLEISNILKDQQDAGVNVGIVLETAWRNMKEVHDMIIFGDNVAHVHRVPHPESGIYHKTIIVKDKQQILQHTRAFDKFKENSRRLSDLISEYNFPCF